MSKKKKAAAVVEAVAENGAAVGAAAMGEGSDELLMAYLAAKVDARRQQREKEALLGAIQMLDRQKAERQQRVYTWLECFFLCLGSLYCSFSAIACAVAGLWTVLPAPLVLLVVLIRKGWFE